jgi:hypothetical protein
LDPEHKPNVGGCVLQSADLGAELVGDRLHQPVCQLPRCEHEEARIPEDRGAHAIAALPGRDVQSPKPELRSDDMSHAQRYEPSPTPSGAWAGWIIFASVILLLLGTLCAIQGFLALFDEGFFIIPREDDLLLVDFTAWGVIMLLWGALLVTAGFGISTGKGWARWFAVVVVSVNVVAQIGFLPAYPIWSAIMIVLDVLIIFALTARWGEAQAAM